jgi:hypothetical protein
MFTLFADVLFGFPSPSLSLSPLTHKQSPPFLLISLSSLCVAGKVRHGQIGGGGVGAKLTTTKSLVVCLIFLLHVYSGQLINSIQECE